MASQDSDSAQSQQKVVLKRKLTGPPRLLLGKAKNMKHGGNRSDMRALRHQKRMDLNGVSQDSTLQESQDNTSKQDTELAQPSEIHSKSAQEELDKSQPRSAQTASSLCGADQEEDPEKTQVIGIRRTVNKSGKDRFRLRRLIPCMFTCVGRRQGKQGSLEINEEVTATQPPPGCTREEIQSTGVICHFSANADSEPVAKNKTDGRKMKTLRLPLLGRHADRGKSTAKASHPAAKDQETQKKSLRKRICRFWIRHEKPPSSKESQSLATPSLWPDPEVKQDNCHLDNNEDSSSIHVEDKLRVESDVEVKVACPDADTLTVSADVTASMVQGSDCDSQGHGNTACHKTLEDLSKTEAEELPEASQMDTSSEPIEQDLKGSSGFLDDASWTHSSGLSSGIRPQIDISSDEVTESWSEEAESSEKPSETAGQPDHCHPDGLGPYRGSADMCFLAVPVDKSWGPREPSSKEVKPYAKPNDSIKPPEHTNLLGAEGLLMLTANSLVQAAIKHALCQLSTETQAPLTNNHPDDYAQADDV